MNKFILLLGFLLNTVVVHAQGRLGLQLSPGLSFNRVHTTPRNEYFSSPGVALRLKLGAIYDYAFQDNHCVSIGLLYSTQRVAIKNTTSLSSINEVHTLHYFQVPLLLKLYTSELTLDTRLYITLGAIGQIRINERNTKLQKEQPSPFIKKFRRWGAAGLLAVGVEYDLGLSTSVFGGISYQYGLSNVIDKQVQDSDSYQLVGYNDVLSVDLGVRF